LRKCRPNQYLSIDTKQHPPFFSLNSTFKWTFWPEGSCRLQNWMGKSGYTSHLYWWRLCKMSRMYNSWTNVCMINIQDNFHSIDMIWFCALKPLWTGVEREQYGILGFLTILDYCTALSTLWLDNSQQVCCIPHTGFS